MYSCIFSIFSCNAAQHFRRMDNIAPGNMGMENHKFCISHFKMRRTGLFHVQRNRNVFKGTYNRRYFQEKYLWTFKNLCSVDAGVRRAGQYFLNP